MLIQLALQLWQLHIYINSTCPTIVAITSMLSVNVLMQDKLNSL